LISNSARVHGYLKVLEEAVDNSVKNGFPVYDSLYVTLALRMKCRLVTFDEELRSRLVEKGVGDKSLNALTRSNLSLSKPWCF
jgi:predicted nucleic acid-binding protein